MSLSFVGRPADGLAGPKSFPKNFLTSTWQTENGDVVIRSAKPANASAESDLPPWSDF